MPITQACIDANRLSEDEIERRKTATNICKWCERPMPAYRLSSRGSWDKRNSEFCSVKHAILYRWHALDDPKYQVFREDQLIRLAETRPQRLKNARLKAAEWHRSEEGRASKRGRKTRGQISASASKSGAAILSAALTAIAGTNIVIAPKIDGRLLIDRSGSKNPKSLKTIRLPDLQIYETSIQAALASGGDSSGVSISCKTGRYHHGYQFMIYDVWVAAGKPSIHPAGKEPEDTRVVRLTDGIVFANAAKAAVDIGAFPTGMSVSIRQGLFCQGHQFMKYSEWIDSGQPTWHPRCKRSKPIDPLTHPVISRHEARKLSLPRYFTGKLCQNGHVAERMTANSDCMECKRIRGAEYARTKRNYENAS